jgi:hypothetical protein
LDTKGTYILQRKTPVFLTEFLRIKRINTHLCKGKKMRRGEGRGEERRKEEERRQEEKREELRYLKKKNYKKNAIYSVSPLGEKM